jgi:hypothetical protein
MAKLRQIPTAWQFGHFQDEAEQESTALSPGGADSSHAFTLCPQRICPPTTPIGQCFVNAAWTVSFKVPIPATRLDSPFDLRTDFSIPDQSVSIRGFDPS